MKMSYTVIIVGGWLLTGQAVAGNGAEMSSSTISVDASADAFTVVLLPDTQYYSEGDSATYHRQTWWCAGYTPPLFPGMKPTKLPGVEPPKMVIHLGDITNDGNKEDQWEAASSAHAVLDSAGIPYTVVPGNHDYETAGGDENKATRYEGRNTTNYNVYFGPGQFQGKPWYGGHFPCLFPKSKDHFPFLCSNDNNYAFFEEGGLEFMVVNLEYAPRPDALCWANALIRDHPKRRVIIVTHGYLDHDRNYTNFSEKDGGSWSALRIWHELVRRHSNVFLVLCGHVGNSLRKTQTPDGPAREGGVKNTVYAILTDYQDETDEKGEKHGQGWLRTLRFVPSENRIYVRTFSVLPGVDRFNAPKKDEEGNDTDENRYPEKPDHDQHSYKLSYDMTTPTSYEYSAYGKTCDCSDPSHHNIAFSGTMRVESGQDPFEILPGRRLIFRDGARLVVDGTLTADGTDSPIWFVSEQDTPIFFAHKQEPRVKISSKLTITGGGGAIRMP